jgi:hypothetical protein
MQSSGKKQPKLTSFFGKRTQSASDTVAKPPTKRPASQTVDLTEEEPPAQPSKRAKHAPNVSPAGPSANGPSLAAVHVNAAVQTASAQPAASSRRSAPVSAAEKSARHAKAQRKLAQEAPRRGREPQKPQPMTPLENQVAICSCTALHAVQWRHLMSIGMAGACSSRRSQR